MAWDWYFLCDVCNEVTTASEFSRARSEGLPWPVCNSCLALDDETVIPDVSPVDCLAMLLEVNSLTPLSLAAETGVSALSISAVLDGTVSFTPEEDARLCTRFKLRSGFFLPKESEK